MLRAVFIVLFSTNALMFYSLESLFCQEKVNLTLFQNTRYIGTASVSEDSNSSLHPKRIMIEVIPIQENGKIKLHFTRMEEESSSLRFYPSTYLLQKPIEVTLTNPIGTFSAEYPPTPDALIPSVTVDGNWDQDKGEISHLRIEMTDHKGTFVMKTDTLKALEPTGYEGLGIIQTDYSHSTGGTSSSAARLIPLLVEATPHEDQIDFIIKTDPSISNSTFSVYNVKISAKLDGNSFEGKSVASQASISGKLSSDRSKLENVRVQMTSGHETYRILAASLNQLHENPTLRTKKMMESLRLEPESCGPVQAIPQRAP